MCGGTLHDGGLLLHGRGLSPRVRGNRWNTLNLNRSLGSIPACAGEPLTVRPRRRRLSVYPRVCGGTCQKTSFSHDDKGLSPRVRGNHRGRVAVPVRNGSIPACAGEPFQSCCLSRQSRVYPRVCGGTAKFRDTTADFDGLSPRVRGNLLFPTPSYGEQRSIPACAGEPMASIFTCAPTRVYPRVCGGTGPGRRQADYDWGLSPRVRGNPRAGHRLSAGAGSIPACAGEPPSRLWSEHWNEVYPRVCGGTGLRSCSRP